MSPSESPQTIDATPALIQLLNKHAIGILCASLLSSKVREEFDALLSATSDKEPVLSRAGRFSLAEAPIKSVLPTSYNGSLPTLRELSGLR